VWHDGTEISSGFQTKPWLVAMTACSTRYRPPADFFGYEVVEASQSWMTVSQHQGARGSHAAPPPVVATLRALLTDNADESRKSEHDSARAIAVATTPSAGPSASERVRERQVVGQKPIHVTRPPLRKDLPKTHRQHSQDQVKEPIAPLPQLSLQGPMREGTLAALARMRREGLRTALSTWRLLE